MHTKRALNVTESFVPEANPWYVPFGFYNDLKKIIKSKQFCPVYITGLSGNGKTMMVEQICANLKREFVRVNITKRTDESDLIGTYELIDGNTIRREGPVITAMRRGAVLLLDEVDYGTEEILCLNGVLEGKPFFDKKTGEIIHAAKGFTVIATANTKGKGSDDGRFIGANVLNEAFLERFAFTWEQEYPEQKVELEIVNKAFESFGINQPEFANKLVTWATVIRKAFNDDAVDEVISTRRLVHIVNAYNIFGSRKKAIEMCLNRYDSEVKTSFLDLYTKIDAEAEAVAVVENSETPAE
jgi:MoxR-like ATPase